uniref:CNNM domain-containing protein n=1 Tax=Prevotella sp. TaxID=59823 RepID=UPI003FEFF5D9
MEVGINLVIGILVTLLFSAFFSGMEIAFVSSNRMLAEMDKDKNKNGVTQRLVSLFYNHPNGFVSTMLVGNNIALVVYGILIARLFDNTIFHGMDAMKNCIVEHSRFQYGNHHKCDIVGHEPG